jgi:uncharacterized membrane protein (DUF2068 family)
VPHQPEDDRSPYAIAHEWVSRVTTIVGVMLLPGFVGLWLDKRWGTNYLTLSGFAVGLTVSIWQLLQLAKEASPTKKSDSKKNNHTNQSQDS